MFETIQELNTDQIAQVSGGDDYCGTLPWRPLHWQPNAVGPEPVPWMPMQLLLPRFGG